MYQKGRNRGDKIFDNSYNQGTIDDISNDPIIVDTEYKNTYLHNEYHSFDRFRLEVLSKEMYEMLKTSEEYAFLVERKNKNIKNRLPEITHFLLSAFDETDYAFSEKFYALCDVLTVGENIIYDSLPPVYKAMAVEEASKLSSIIRNKNRFQIF